MKKISKQRLRQILIDELSLEDGELFLRGKPGWQSQTLVSNVFFGMRDRKRLKMVTEALERVLGKGAFEQVGMVFPFSWPEWDFHEDPERPSRKVNGNGTVTRSRPNAKAGKSTRVPAARAS